MWEIKVSRAGDKALTRETPAKRGRVNRYEIHTCRLTIMHVQNVYTLCDCDMNQFCANSYM